MYMARGRIESGTSRKDSPELVITMFPDDVLVEILDF